AGGVLPDVDEVAARAGALLPEGFPWAEEPDAAQRWMTWATEILPAGATFLPVDHPEWEAVEGTVWGKDTIGFETGNLVFLSRSEDAAVVGRCLRNGEGTVRVLEGLLAATRSERGKIAPFRVRLHKNRPQYIAEDGGSASTLGYYVPREQVSRFFVPDADVSDPLGRQLHEVLSHELTHQYIAERWIGAADTVPRQEGYWIVEGFARFIDDQITELGRRGGPKLDDPTVPSVETMVALAEEQGWHPFEDLVDWTQTDFIRLPNHELMASVRLRTTLGVRSLSPVGMFYDQGGALVFFLMHHRGAEGRAQLIEYMREYYEEGATQQGWEQLGFATAQELETAFLEFLTELAE
ncbi:MAG: hypothetical protein O2816_15230, partial [Planctomycetota bacterium]|nr:hypothetical protein [Planctomycetota bacterium]